MGSGARERLSKEPVKRVEYLDHPQFESGWAEQFARWVEAELNRIREARRNEDPEPSTSDEESDHCHEEKND